MPTPQPQQHDSPSRTRWERDRRALAAQAAAAWSAAPHALRGPAAEWIRSRKLDPLRVPGQLVRGVPERPPRRMRGFLGYEAVIPAFDLHGQLASLQARRASGDPRGRAPKGPRKVVFANPAGVELLAGRGDPGQLVVVSEGEGDWLVWATLQPVLPVFGVVSGMAPLLGARLAELGVKRVAVRTDPDPAGDRYAELLGVPLAAAGVQLYRPEVRIPLADPEKAALGHHLDDGDRWALGQLPLDPLGDVRPWAPPRRNRAGKAVELPPARVRAATVYATPPEEVERLVRSVLRPAKQAGKPLPMAVAVQDRRPPGAGKTTLAARELVAGAAEGRRYLFATFSHNHADAEVLPALRRGGAVIWSKHAIKRRPEGDVVAAKVDAFDCLLPAGEGARNVKRYGELAKRGWNPVSVICQRCDQFPREAERPCPYWRRRRLVQAEAEILVAVHHSVRAGAEVEAQRDALVLDEDPSSALVKEASATAKGIEGFLALAALAVEELQAKADRTAEDEPETKKAASAQRASEAATAAAEEIHAAAGGLTGGGLTQLIALELGAELQRTGHLPPVATLGAPEGVDPQRLLEGLSALEAGCLAVIAKLAALGKPGAGAGEDGDGRGGGGKQRREARAKLRPARAARNLVPFFRLLAEAWAAGVVAVLVPSVQGEGRVSVAIPYVEPLPSLPTLALDATGDPQILARATGLEVQAIEGDLVAPLRGTVLADAACGRKRWRPQVLGGQGKLLEDLPNVVELVRRAQFGARLPRRGRKPGKRLRIGLLAHKEHLPAWTEHLEAQLAAEVRGLYYGGARGSNAFEGWADVVVMLGTPFVAAESLALRALLYGASADEVRAAAAEEESWERRALPGGGVSMGLRFPGPATQRAHEALVEAELEQALGRASRREWTPPLGVVALASPWPTRHPLRWTNREREALEGPAVAPLEAAWGAALGVFWGSSEGLEEGETIEWNEAEAATLLESVAKSTRGEGPDPRSIVVEAIAGRIGGRSGRDPRAEEIACALGISRRGAFREIKDADPPAGQSQGGLAQLCTRLDGECQPSIGNPIGPWHSPSNQVHKQRVHEHSDQSARTPNPRRTSVDSSQNVSNLIQLAALVHKRRGALATQLEVTLEQLDVWASGERQPNPAQLEALREIASEGERAAEALSYVELGARLAGGSARLAGALGVSEDSAKSWRSGRRSPGGRSRAKLEAYVEAQLAAIRGEPAPELEGELFPVEPGASLPGVGKVYAPAEVPAAQAQAAAATQPATVLSPSEAIHRGLEEFAAWADPALHPGWAIRAAKRAKGISSLATQLGTRSVGPGMRVVDQDLALERAQELADTLGQPIYARRLWGEVARTLAARGARAGRGARLQAEARAGLGGRQRGAGSEAVVQAARRELGA